MPITKSAKKALRQNLRRRIFNLRRARKMKSLIKQIRGLIKENEKQKAFELLPKVYQAIDKAAKKGIIKKNTASRKKSRLSKAIKRLQKGQRPSPEKSTGVDIDKKNQNG